MCVRWKGRGELRKSERLSDSTAHCAWLKRESRSERVAERWLKGFPACVCGTWACNWEIMPPGRTVPELRKQSEKPTAWLSGLRHLSQSVCSQPIPSHSPDWSQVGHIHFLWPLWPPGSSATACWNLRQFKLNGLSRMKYILLSLTKHFVSYSFTILQVYR